MRSTIVDRDPLFRKSLTDNLKLYLVHFPVAFQKGDSYFPLVEGSTVEGGDVIIDDDVSIVDTWKGEWTLIVRLDTVVRD